MKTTFLSISAIFIFIFYIIIISVSMLIEVSILSYLFFPNVIKYLRVNKKFEFENNTVNILERI
jgi:hypothetical protein